MHDAVEAETIKSSVLRHKLGDFPRDIEKEVSGNCSVLIFCWYRVDSEISVLFFLLLVFILTLYVFVK